ncbi:MAG: hypothetical protein ACLP0B_00580 [Steroidobacteraceae bacterium]
MIEMNLPAISVKRVEDHGSVHRSPCSDSTVTPVCPTTIEAWRCA